MLLLQQYNELNKNLDNSISSTYQQKDRIWKLNSKIMVPLRIHLRIRISNGIIGATKSKHRKMVKTSPENASLDPSKKPKIQTSLHQISSNFCSSMS